MKKGPLSKQEKTYVQENHEKMTATIMADKMDRSVHIVDKYITSLGSKDDVKTTDKSIADSSSLYVRDSNKVATIMTEAASAASDESRKRPTTPKRYTGIIHKIKED